MPKRCGTRARCSLGAGRDVTLTSFPAMWVSGLAGWGSAPWRRGQWTMWAYGLDPSAGSISQPSLVCAGVGRWCGCHFSPEKQA